MAITASARLKQQTSRGARSALAVLLLAAAMQVVALTAASAGDLVAPAGDSAPKLDANAKANAFRAVLKKFAAHQKPDPALMQQFAAAQNDGLQTGPKVGRKVPDFRLPDQNGRELSLHQLMGPKGLLLVFVRSADWCPFCRSELVELQDSVAALARNGVNTASISYDPQGVLRRFSARYHITYPMLSDRGSVVIRKFGILNTNVPKDATRFYGMPFPGQYLLTPDGIVADKLFMPDFRTRPTASVVLLKDFGAAVGGSLVTVKAEDVTAKIVLSDSRCFSGQLLGLMVDFEVAPGWHVYGQPLPASEGLTPTGLRFDSALVAGQSLKLPTPQTLKVKELAETLPVYTGSFKATGALLMAQNLTPGEHKLSGTLSFQECSSDTCKIPQTIRFEIPIQIEPLAPAVAAK